MKYVARACVIRHFNVNALIILIYRAQKTTCHDHRAVLTARLERANLEATGIGAAACSRHGFFTPHACVDFQKGEWYLFLSCIAQYNTMLTPCSGSETWIIFSTGSSST